MGGICGVLSFRGERVASHGYLARMCERLSVSRTTDENLRNTVLDIGSVGLAVAKSDVDLLSGIAQAAGPKGASTLAFCGRLYNLSELSGVPIHGQGALDALLSLFQQQGTGVLSRMRGEFVLAFWDADSASLHVAIDRFRVYPLVYFHDDERLVFGSTMGAVLAGVDAKGITIRLEAIVDVVASSAIPTPRTIFNEVRKLPPGFVLTAKGGRVILGPYWDIDFRAPSRARPAALIKETKRQFQEAMDVRLRAAGPKDDVGSFLSGGVDSSTVTGVLTYLLGRPIKSFSIGFGEQSFNEISYARLAAKRFGAEHHEYFVTPRDVYDVLPVMLAAFDEPFGNASAVPTYYCAKLAAETGVRTLFAGDGGDELFAGNERYATQRLFDYYNDIPAWIRKSLIERIVSGLARWSSLRVAKKAAKYIRRASIPYPDRLVSYGFFSVVPIGELFAPEFLDALDWSYDPDGAVKRHYKHANAHTELDHQLYVDLKLAISDNDLLKVERMTRAAGVTVHFPFLDHRLAEFAATIPARVKMRGRRLRSFFKEAYSDLLPVEVRNKTKHGFGLPIPIWLRSDKQLRELMHDLVLSPRTLQRGYFRKEALNDLVRRHEVDPTSFYGTALWNLMILELWHRHQEAAGRALSTR